MTDTTLKFKRGENEVSAVLTADDEAWNAGDMALVTETDDTRATAVMFGGERKVKVKFNNGFVGQKQRVYGVVIAAEPSSSWSPGDLVEEDWELTRVNTLEVKVKDD